MEYIRKQLREGMGMLNMPAMDVTQVISFFADLLGKSKAAFDSAGIMGKIFYGITTVILKGLNLLGSWISQIADWLCGLMGGTVPSSPNWTYGKLLIFAAVSAVILWGVRKIWRRIRGHHYGYYESMSIDEQNKILKSIREDSRMFTRMQMLTEADGSASQQPTDMKKQGILTSLIKWIFNEDIKRTALDIAGTLRRDTIRLKQDDPYNKQNDQAFDDLLEKPTNFFLSFLKNCGAEDSNTFIGNISRKVYANQHVVRNLANGTLFYMFPALTSLYFGGRAISAGMLKNPSVKSYIQNKVKTANPDTFSKTLGMLAKLVYSNQGTGNPVSRSEFFKNLTNTFVKPYFGNITALKKTFNPVNIGRALTSTISAAASGASWVAKNGLKFGGRVITNSGRLMKRAAAGAAATAAQVGAGAAEELGNRMYVTHGDESKLGALGYRIGNWGRNLQQKLAINNAQAAEDRIDARAADKIARDQVRDGNVKIAQREKAAQQARQDDINAAKWQTDANTNDAIKQIRRKAKAQREARK